MLTSAGSFHTLALTRWLSWAWVCLPRIPLCPLHLGAPSVQIYVMVRLCAGASCKLGVAMGGATKAAGAADCVLAPIALWAIGEVGSVRSPKRRLWKVGTMAPLRHVPLRRCWCVTSVVWVARWLTWEASIVRVWSLCPPLFSSCRCLILSPS